MNFTRLSLLATSTMLSACAIDSKNVVENRWASMVRVSCQSASCKQVDEPFHDPAKMQTVDYQPTIRVTSETVSEKAADGGSKLAIKDLSDHGQSTLVEKLDASLQRKPDKQTHTKLLDAIGMSATKSAAAGDTIGHASATTLKRTLVVNVMSNKHLQPGDRLQNVTITVTPRNASFIAFSNAKTESVTTEFGTITQTTERSVDATLSPTLTGAIVGTGELTASSSTSKEAQGKVIEAITPLNLNIDGKALTIQKQANSHIDISGNTIVSVTLSVDPDVSSEKTTWTAFTASSVNLVTKGALISDCAAPTETTETKPACTISGALTTYLDDETLFKQGVLADIAVSATTRLVRSGANTITETDDDIILVDTESSPTAPQVLIPRNAIVGEKYMVIGSSSTHRCPVKVGVKPFPGTYPLLLQDKDGAKQVTLWLKSKRPHQLTSDTLLLDTGRGDKPVAYEVMSRADWLAMRDTSPNKMDFCIPIPPS